MKILFYSTNSNVFDAKALDTKVTPSYARRLEELAQSFPEHEFFVVTQLPGDFLLDLDDGMIREKSASVRYVVSEANDAATFAEEVLALKPDVAIAMTFWVTPYDWLPIKDSLVAKLLREKGIVAIAHSTETAMLCFDKSRSQSFLQDNGFNVPKSVYIHHELFWCERGHKEIASNAYKELVFSQIKELSFPVIVKDTLGLSSYSMEVLPTFNSIKDYLLSRKNSSDRIIQEYISGEQFGLEICGTEGNYSVLPPFMFSVNKFGITNPKQSVKIGPVTNQKFHLAELEIDMLRLAEKLRLCGTAQVDLVFDNGKWFILEINPRLSGMSELYSECMGKSLYQRLLEIALEHRGRATSCDHSDLRDHSDSRDHSDLCDNSDLRSAACNFKLPILNDEQLELLRMIPFIKQIRQIHNKAAKQERERGYCEIIFTAPDISSLMEHLDALTRYFPELVEPVFLENARRLAISACFRDSL